MALAQVKAMTLPEAGGERFIVSNGPYSGNDVCVVSEMCSGTLTPKCGAHGRQVLNKEFPDLPDVPKGDTTPGYRESLVATSNFVDGSKAVRVLGITYRSLEETFRDTAKSLITRFNM